MTKEIVTTAKGFKRGLQLALYNLSIFVFGTALVLSGYGSWKYAETLHGFDQRLYKAAAVLIIATGIYAYGKWLVNKELEVK